MTHSSTRSTRWALGDVFLGPTGSIPFKRKEVAVRKLLGGALKIAKVGLLVVWRSLVRVGKAQGEGVFEVAMQNAISDVATKYVRSVSG